MGKYFILKALVQSNHWILAISAALYIVPAVFYYFRVIVHAWLKKPGENMSRPLLTTAQVLALVICVFVTLAAGLYPEPFTHLARYALGQ